MPFQRTTHPSIYSTIAFSLCRRGDHHRRNEHGRRSHGAALAVAERVCRARHWSIRRECLDHVIVFNAAGLHSGRRVHCVLHALANPSRDWQGHAEPTPGHTAISPWHRRHPRSRRTTPPLRSHRRVAVARRRSQTLPAVIPFVQHVRLALNDCPCRLFREQRYGTARTNTQVAGFEMECPDLVSIFR